MKILFFSPHAYWSEHALPEALVANSLMRKGIEIIYVGCNSILKSYCLCMSGTKSDSDLEEKSIICKNCKKHRDKINLEFKLTSIFIDDFITQLEAKKIDILLEKIDINHITEFKYLDYEVGKISLYEFLLNRKLNTTILNVDEFLEFKLHVKNSLITLLAGLNIFKSFNIDRLVTYNSLYSVNNIMCSIATANNIPHFMLHAGSHHKYRLSEMTIFKGLTEWVLINDNNKWHEYSRFPISKKSLYKAFEHVTYLLKARSPWVYSIKSNNECEFDLRYKIGIKSDQKILLALMASADERFAANIIGALPIYPESFFPTQIDWIKYLINLAKSDNKIFIIIRVHPREFPNKRENVLSKQAALLSGLFENLPNNCYINYPKDNFSLYDLIKITNVGLNATSTAGLELLLFGIPVIIYDKNQLFSYGREMNMIANDEDDYKNKIYTAINMGYNINNIILAFRWIAYKSEIVSIDISDGYKINTKTKLINRLKKIFSIPTLLTPIKNKNKPLKEIEKLTYAIIQNKLSHINTCVINKENDEETEKKLIKYFLKKYFKKIVHKNDKTFKKRMYNILNEKNENL